MAVEGTDDAESGTRSQESLVCNDDGGGTDSGRKEDDGPVAKVNEAGTLTSATLYEWTKWIVNSEKNFDAGKDVFYLGMPRYASPLEFLHVARRLERVMEHSNKRARLAALVLGWMESRFQVDFAGREDVIKMAAKLVSRCNLESRSKVALLLKRERAKQKISSDDSLPAWATGEEDDSTDSSMSGCSSGSYTHSLLLKDVSVATTSVTSSPESSLESHVPVSPAASPSALVRRKKSKGMRPHFLRRKSSTQKTPTDAANLDVPELAAFMTRLDYRVYCNIRPHELVKNAWGKSNREQISPNVHTMGQIYNQTSLWVAHELLLAASPALRTKTHSMFVSLAERLRRLHNYQRCFAVVAGINHFSVTRLMFSKAFRDPDPVVAKRAADLTGLASPENNFQAYRAEIDAIPTGLAAVPLHAVTLRDLVHNEDAYPDTIDGRLINVLKITQEAALISRLLAFQRGSTSALGGTDPPADIYALPGQIMSANLHEEVLFDISRRLRPVKGSDGDGDTSNSLAVTKVLEYEFLRLCRKGDAKAVAAQLETAIVTVSCANDVGETGLHYACAAGHSKVARTLLVAGANPNMQSESGKTPTHFLVFPRDVTLLKILLEHDADISLLDNDHNILNIVDKRARDVVLKTFLRRQRCSEWFETNAKVLGIDKRQALWKLDKTNVTKLLSRVTALWSQQCVDQVRDSLHVLHLYLHVKFACENAQMAETRYPGTKTHKDEHTALLNNLRGIVVDFVVHMNLETKRFQDFSTLLLDHFGSYDEKAFKHIREDELSSYSTTVSQNSVASNKVAKW